MPCYSTVTQTKITDAARLVKALTALNIPIYDKNELRVDTDLGVFTRQSKTASFQFRGTETEMAPVGRKYAEMTVKEWGIRNGMSITANDGRKIQLQKRR